MLSAPIPSFTNLLKMIFTISASSGFTSSIPFFESNVYPKGAWPPFHFPSLAFCFRPSIVCTRMFSRSISATADNTVIVSFPESFDESIPSSTQIRFTPKSCMYCKELRTSAALRPNLDNLNTKMYSTPSLSSATSCNICVNSGRPVMLFPDFPASQYSLTTSISWNSANFVSLSFWASRLYPSTCIAVDTRIYI